MPFLWYQLFYVKNNIIDIISLSISLIILNIILGYFYYSSKKIRYTFGFFNGITFIIDLFCLYRYDSVVNKRIIDIVITTNKQEIFGFLNSAITIDSILFIIFISFLWYFIKKLKKYIPLFIRNKSIFITLCILTFITNGVAIVFTNSDTAGLTNGIARYLWYTINEINIYNKKDVIIQDLTKYRENINVKTNSNLPKVIIILGESLTKKHMSLYGYKIDTTPNLLMRYNKNEIILFKDVTSTQTYTNGAMKDLFIYDKGYDKWWENGSIFEDLEKAGIKTYWLSSQTSSGKSGSFESVLANRCSDYAFSNYNDNHNNLIYDKNLLELYSKKIKNNSERKLVLFHLIGSHFPYKLRYPEEFNVFNYDNENHHKNIKQRRIIASYDNSVLYTDDFLNTLFNMEKYNDTVVIFISDHAEELFEIDDFNGHGFSTPRTHPNNFQQDIPLFVWCSNTFKFKHYNEYNYLKKQSEKTFVSTDFIKLIQGLYNLEYAN